MATRYCRNVKIDCKLVPAPHMPHGEQYKCNLSENGKRLGVQYVGLPVHLESAIDSPSMVDQTAHAALTFATDDGTVDEGVLEFTDSGFAIRRQKSYRHNLGPRGGGMLR